jgi:23S rRNA pseudouridine2605 synthase
MHPRYGIEREYLVRAAGVLTKTQRRQLIDGIKVDGRPAAFKEIKAQRSSGGLNRWYRVVITQGRYREVRRLFETMGISVNRLKRLRFGFIRLPEDLPPGSWRRLSDPSITRLLDFVASAENDRASNQ